jgi:hypothetical protein
MNMSTKRDPKICSDDELLALLSTLDRRTEARLIQQVRMELGVRGIYFIERVVTELGQRRLEISRREAVTPSRGMLLSGTAPTDWSVVRGYKFFVVATFFAMFAFVLPNLGVMPVFSVSQAFLIAFYCIAALFALLFALLHRRDFQTAVRKWRVEQLLLLVNAGLVAFILQNPLMLAVHHLTAKKFLQNSQVIDLKRNSDWCKRSVVVELTQALPDPSNNSTASLNSRGQPLRFCGFSMTEFDLLRPNDRLTLQGSHSVAAIIVEQVQVMTEVSEIVQ